MASCMYVFMKVISLEFKGQRLPVEQLSGLDQSVGFVLKTEPESTLQQIMRVLDRLTLLGVTQVSLADSTL